MNASKNPGTSRDELIEMLPWIGGARAIDPLLKLLDQTIAENDTMAAIEFERIKTGAARARQLGLEVHAGHGLDFHTAETISMLPEIVELNIGHFLIGEAVFAGLAEAVRMMRAAMDRGRAKP